MFVKCKNCNTSFDMSRMEVEYSVNKKEKMSLSGILSPTQNSKSIEITSLTCPECKVVENVNINILNYTGNNLLERLTNEIKLQAKVSSIKTFQFYDGGNN